jgi:hypothetical protein
MNEEGTDIFDDLDALKAPRPEVERAPIGMVVQRARGRRAKPFGMIPLGMAERIGGITNVVVHLAYQMALSGGKPVPVTAARSGCKSYKVRMRALRLLEDLGIAKIEWRGNGRAPLLIRLF